MPIPVVVDLNWCSAHPGTVLADVRWYLDGRSGRAAYEAGHLPGSVFVDLDADLAGHGGPPTGGRHPLPRPEGFAAAMGRLGIGDDSLVVAYDDTGGMTAGRLVVMLRSLGRAAALLDGGLLGYDGPLEAGPPPDRPAATFTAVAWPDRFVTDADALVEAQAGGTTVVDARANDRYRGEPNPVDHRLGHIPGARNLPWAAVLDGGRLRPTAEIRAAFAARGITEGSSFVASCGSGVSACLDLIAAEHAGLGTGALFVPSWSGWAADPARPAATGDQ
jgi:thiosulfate/3-mercaptopyruvate sulfurtransferase